MNGRSILKFVVDKNYRWQVKAARGYYDTMPDDKYLCRKWKIKMGYDLDLNDPKTYNEKLQWIKINDRKPIYTIMVDKYAVKDYVAGIIGEEYIIPTLAVWDSADDIDFDMLPEQFVLKCTHDSHGLVICRDKSTLDVDEARKKLSAALKRNYYYAFREWPYKDVPPRIIAEQYLEETHKIVDKDKKTELFGGIALMQSADKEKLDAITGGSESFSTQFDKVSTRSTSVKAAETLYDKLIGQHPLLSADFYRANGSEYYGNLMVYGVTAELKDTLEGFVDPSGQWIHMPQVSKYYERSILLASDLLFVLVPRKSLDVPPLRDYKIYTFNGKAKICMINQDRGNHTRADYFDRDYNWLDFTWGYDHADVRPEKPENYEKMFELAEALAKDTLELRVDFYDVNGRIYFGELTFFDGSGFDKIFPVEWDERMGSWIDLGLAKNRKE